MNSKGMKLLVFSGILIILGSVIHANSFADDPSLGKILYQAHCIQCHGVKGDGNGLDAASYNPRPRDFTSNQMSEITDPMIEKAMLAGLPTVSAHSWGTRLSSSEVVAVIGYIRSFRQ